MTFRTHPDEKGDSANNATIPPVTLTAPNMMFLIPIQVLLSATVINYPTGKIRRAQLPITSQNRGQVDLLSTVLYHNHGR